jgi:hypothetical protein
LRDTADLLTAMTAMASFGVAVFFLRYWHQARERLFLYFALGFALLGANWTILSALSATQGPRHLVYLIRLFGFVLIIVGVVDKNRARRDE